jgi:3-hydroxyacyl-CoA dehydrogenase
MKVAIIGSGVVGQAWAIVDKLYTFRSFNLLL